jgi:hypothetical protein
MANEQIKNKSNCDTMIDEIGKLELLESLSLLLELDLRLIAASKD